MTQRDIVNLKDNPKWIRSERRKAEAPPIKSVNGYIWEMDKYGNHRIVDPDGCGGDWTHYAGIATSPDGRFIALTAYWEGGLPVERILEIKPFADDHPAGNGNVQAPPAQAPVAPAPAERQPAPAPAAAPPTTPAAPPAGGAATGADGPVRTFVFDEDELTWEEINEAEWPGDHRPLVTAEPVMVTMTKKAWLLQCPIYYQSEGIFSMSISQPLNRALMTFGAALKADSRAELNGSDADDWMPNFKE